MRRFGFAVVLIGLVWSSLLSAELVPFTIRTEPDGVTVIIDGEVYGATVQNMLGDFLAPGTYSLELLKHGYSTIETSITIRANSDNSFAFNLTSNTGFLTVHAQPADATIYIDDEDYSSYNGQSVTLPEGRYRIAVCKDGWETSTYLIDLQRNGSRTVNISLDQLTGGFKFVVQPLSAAVELRQNGQVVRQWTGNKLDQNMPVGQYDITVTANGFKSQTGVMQVKEGEMKDVRVSLEPGRNLVDFTSPSGFEMVAVKGAQFTMGYEDKPANSRRAHPVILSDFFIGKYEVTQRQYYKVMGEPVSSHTDLGVEAPVENVTWFDAVVFCNRLSEMEGLTSCYTIDKSTYPWTVSCDFDANGYRLPTEAEWEFAARGGVKSEGYRYSGGNSIYNVAWHWRERMDDWDNPNPRPVGQKRANELGIYDMTGNVWEWCWDWFWTYYPHDCCERGVVTNPTADEDWTSGGKPDRQRVIRGGCIEDFNDDPSFYVYARNESDPIEKNHYSRFLGFRIASSER